MIFPFIIGFPGEPDDSVQASLDVAKRLRAMSPGFETPIFYFKPYPGTPGPPEASGAAPSATRDVLKHALFFRPSLDPGCV